LHAAAQQQIGEAREARKNRRYVEMKLNEIYRSMATGCDAGKARERGEM